MSVRVRLTTAAACYILIIVLHVCLAAILHMICYRCMKENMGMHWIISLLDGSQCRHYHLMLLLVRFHLLLLLLYYHLFNCATTSAGATAATATTTTTTSSCCC
jgi:hypothetical protein